MQYVRGLSESVSTAWNSINPATLSGAIDVIVVEAPDGTLSCSPFHVRFGKFSLLRPYEKKVEFRVNGKKQHHAMKLAEGGEAFFVFETSDTIPQALQTSPLVSPASSPPLEPDRASNTGDDALPEPTPFELEAPSGGGLKVPGLTRPPPRVIYSSSLKKKQAYTTSPEMHNGVPVNVDWTAFGRHYSEDVLQSSGLREKPSDSNLADQPDTTDTAERSQSPPRLQPRAALQRAMTLSRGLEAVNIPTQITETGDLMLDMTGFKQNEDDALRAEILARKVLSEELQGNYDIGALFGLDDQGNLWIYSSEEAKDAAMKKSLDGPLRGNAFEADAVSDPGYHSDDSSRAASVSPSHRRTESDAGPMSVGTPPSSPGSLKINNEPSRNYAKTLRLTSDQLKALDLKPGENSMSFTVNKATCSAYMFLWKHETPVVISDIDGTITKSDALGQVLNMIGRDWTHIGVAKLYCDIITNGYNIMYLTSRSVGLADTTRAYLAGITQGGYRLPRGPTILSPDRTMAALRREVYLRKPHIFKMATLRDIRNLYGADYHPFYAGFGNRLTDQISYRTVDVPRTRIFTINSNAEVSLDLLSLNKLKLSYVNITEVVDHYFPPVSTIVRAGGEEYTDFTYWRDTPLDLDDFSASDSESDGATARAPARGRAGRFEEKNAAKTIDEEQEDEEDDDEEGDLGNSYMSRNSLDDYGTGSVLSNDAGNEEQMMSSMMSVEEDDEADDEDEAEEEATSVAQVNAPKLAAEEHVAQTDFASLKSVENSGLKAGHVGLPKGESTGSMSSSSLAPPGNDKRLSRTPSPSIAVKDEDAELITGVSGLSMEKVLDA